ncbi:MAG TPA: MFS transporter [Ktedonobacteraceae bacterium]|nr:MFS transporter [Ktedonobacteraceae bacterium]
MAFRIRSTVSRPRAHSLSVLRLALLSVALLDELTAGFPVIGLPLLRDRFGLSYQQVGLLFTVGALAAMLLEPIISLLSDRDSKRWWIIGGAFLLALSSALTGNLTQYVLLLLAFMLSNPAGAAAGLAQAALIDSAPQEETRSMTRWTLLSSVGDFLSPLAVAALVAIHFGWTALCWFGAALWLIVAIFLCFQRFPQPASMKGEKSKDATEQNVTVWAGLRDALRDPVLLRWAVLSIIPTMVDEVFLGFEALYLRDVLHTSQEAVALIVAIQMVGAMLGLFALDHVVSRMHIAPHRLLRWLALLTLVGVIAFLATRSTVFAASALFIISLSAAGWYPIAKGQAYARLPGRSGTVRAVVSLGAPFDMLLPGIVGLIAGRFGLLVGLGFLGLAPVLMLLLIPRANK